MSRKIILHKTDVILNKDKLKDILDSKDLTYIQLWERVVESYGLDLSYKGFMSLMTNRSSWKLLYAYAIVDVLGISLKDIFDIIDVDIEEKLKEKEQWRKQYQEKANERKRKKLMGEI